MKVEPRLTKLIELLFVTLLIVTTNSCVSSYESKDLKRVNEELSAYLNVKLNDTTGKVYVRFEGFRDADERWISIPYKEELWLELRRSNPKLIPYTNALGHIISMDAPKWFNYNKSSKVFYKQDFLNRTFSELYLWKSDDSKRIYIYVHFFD